MSKTAQPNSQKLNTYGQADRRIDYPQIDNNLNIESKFLIKMCHSTHTLVVIPRQGVKLGIKVI